MNANIYFTNDDCEKCCCSWIIDVSCDYQENEWECEKGYDINNTTEKKCALPAGSFYKQTLCVSTEE